MARKSGNSLSSSLRGKIWVSTIVLAFFVCTFGLISYLVVSLVINDAFYGIFLPFLFLAFTIMLFGWWLSNEIVNPIEKVTLLATSLERSTSTSIPKTSGSAETDQLLKTIQRNNQQIQKIVTQMDKVASGNLDIAPMEGNDRLSSSFQKLLAKVSESISAKEELDEINKAVSDLKQSIEGVRSGNLDVYIRNEYEQTKELAATFKYLIDNFSKLITSVQKNALAADMSVKRVEDEIGMLRERDENRVQELSGASTALKEVPNLINKITEDLMGSAKSARQSIEKARHGNEIASQNSTSVSNLRKQIREDVRRIQNLTEKAHDIERVAKTVADLANRTNMIALNASIQATELGEDGHGFVLVAEEVERLATRANGTNKQISTLNKTILAEIGKVENSAETTMAEVASLSKFAIETGNVMSELERYVAHFLNLQESLIAYSKDQSEETEAAFGTFAKSISETEMSVERLSDSSRELESLSKIMKDLNLAVGEFRLPEELPIFSSAPPNKEEPEMYDGESNVEPFSGQTDAPDVSHDVETSAEAPIDSGEFPQVGEDDAESFSEEFYREALEAPDDAPESADDFALESFHHESSDSLDSHSNADEQNSDFEDFSVMDTALVDEAEFSVTDITAQEPDLGDQSEYQPDEYSSQDDLVVRAKNDIGDKDGVDTHAQIPNNEPEESVFDSGEFTIDEMISAADPVIEQSEESVFDSGEFAIDEIITATDPVEEQGEESYSAHLAALLQKSQKEDQADPGSFDDAVIIDDGNLPA